MRSGFTLIELIVVLAILGIIGIVAGLAMDTTVSTAPQNPAYAQIKVLRDSALSSGKAITATITTDSQPYIATAYPDGSVITNAEGVERVTGRPVAKR